jgi:hypothetical protein
MVAETSGGSQGRGARFVELLCELLHERVENDRPDRLHAAIF